MSTLNLLYKNEYAINDHIKIVIPTVGEIVDNEDEYYSLVTILTAMPIDLMIPLEEAGIDYTRGVMHLDGSSLQAGELDKTFEDFGIAEKCFLLNVVKADNA